MGKQVSHATPEEDAIIRTMTLADYFAFGRDMSRIWDKPRHAQWYREATYERCSLKDRDGQITVLHSEMHGKHVGVSGWYMEDDKYAVMRWHGVLQGFRGNGYSKKLLEDTKFRVRAYGPNVLYELSDSEAAKNYFLHNGFQLETDETVIEAINSYDDEFRFKYVLRADL